MDNKLQYKYGPHTACISWMCFIPSVVLRLACTQASSSLLENGRRMQNIGIQLIGDWNMQVPCRGSTARLDIPCYLGNSQTEQVMLSLHALPKTPDSSCHRLMKLCICHGQQQMYKSCAGGVRHMLIRRRGLWDVGEQTSGILCQKGRSQGGSAGLLEAATSGAPTRTTAPLPHPRRWYHLHMLTSRAHCHILLSVRVTL